MEKLRVFGIVLLLVLVGYNLYTGATVQKIGIPGIFEIQFGPKPPTAPPPPPPTATSTPGSLQITANANKAWPAYTGIPCLVAPGGSSCPTPTPEIQGWLSLSTCKVINASCEGGLVAIRFDLTRIPTGAIIKKAVLNLFVYGGSNLQTHIKNAITPWKEDEPTRPQCDPAIQIDENANYQWNKWDVTDMVQSQVSKPLDNYGFCIYGGDIIFLGREGQGTTVPYLEITYQP